MSTAPPAPDTAAAAERPRRRSEGSRGVVVITGGSAGVGRASAREFARAGYDVAVVARDPARLRDTERDVEEAGREALSVSADVADFDALDSAAERVEAELGPIDVWVNNAMTSVFAPVTEVKPEEFRRVTEVTYLGVVHGTLVALKRMKPRDRGVIVQVGSALAFRGIPLQAAYCASKHAIKGFTDSLRAELLHDGSRVRVSIAHMPALNTPQFEWVLSRLERQAQPVPPIFQPEVAARAVRWIAEHDRRDLVVGFSTFKTIWGSRVAPGFLDRFLASKGYSGQQTDEREDPERPGNLWKPVPGDYAARGRFTARSKPRSPFTRLLRRPWLVALAALVVVGAVAWGVVALIG